MMVGCVDVGVTELKVLDDEEAAAACMQECCGVCACGLACVCECVYAFGLAEMCW